MTLGQDTGGAKPAAIGGDRGDLGLPGPQVALINAAASAGKPVVVVVVAGSAVLVEDWVGDANALLQTFYAGMEGGTALAQLLAGDISPSGKLPFSVAADAAHYPEFDRDADAITYDRWHGYAKLRRDQRAPRCAFGHGLSYARFAYRALNLRATPTQVIATVAVTNHGALAADEIVQLYVSQPDSVPDAAERLLKAFARVTLAPGETKVVTLPVARDDLRWWDDSIGGWRFAPGTYIFLAGGSSQATLGATIAL
jgi:beta-glucosidase